MHLPAAEFKKLVKKLAAVEGDRVSLDFQRGALFAADNLLTVVAINRILNSDDAAVSVSARQLNSVAGKTTGRVELTSSPGELKIKAAKAEWRLGTAEYKPLTVPALKGSCTVALAQIASLLKFASVAAEAKNQFTFSGLIRLASDKNHLTAVATNGKCMTIESIDAAGEAFEFLIPAATVKALGAFEGEDIWIGDAGSAICFGTGDAEKSLTVIARKNSQLSFPNWQSAVPNRFTFEASVKKSDLEIALDNVSPALSDNKAVQLVFENDQLHLRAGADGSFADDEIEFAGITPDPVFEEPVAFRTKLNHRQMSEFAAAATEDITFHSRGPGDPTLLTSGGKKMLIAAYLL